MKVLAMMEDCIKYVLNDPYPTPIIDLEQYVALLGEGAFDRNAIAVENAIGDLPDIYKSELVNRLFTVYTHESASSVLRSNTEFVVPILWRVLPKDVRIQTVRRVDQIIAKGHAASTAQAFAFVQVVDAAPYLSATARKYRVDPIIKRLSESLDKWQEENEIVRELAPYAAIVPPDLLFTYVASLTKTYVGVMGGSGRYARTDFYADGAALVIPDMFAAFDDRAAEAFVDTIRSDTTLQGRIRRPAKLNRLRALGHIVSGRASQAFPGRSLLEKLLDDSREAEFWAELGKAKIPSPSAP